MGLLAWCNCNNHYYFSGLLQVQQTAQLVGYCYNKYVCWFGASVSDMHACMHKFTDMTVGKMQLFRYEKWPDAIATDMADGPVQM